MGEEDRMCGAETLRRVASLAAFGVVLATTVAAQGSVVPGSQANVEASGGTNVPFGRTTPVRVQMAYAPRLFPGPVVIDAVVFRLDGGVSVTGKQVDFEIRASTMPFGIAAMQARFASNRGGDEAVVRDRASMMLPSVAASGGQPEPFSVRLPFDRSFAFDPAGGPLLLEVVVHGQDPGEYRLDATFLCSSPRGDVGPVGCGAPALSSSVPTAQVLWGRPFTLLVEHAPAGGAAGVVIGSRANGSWVGLALPIDLGALGAPGCYVSIDWLVPLAGVADGNGRLAVPVNVPSRPGMQGQWIRYQGVALDPTANAMGVVTSQAHRVQICGWEPVARVYAPSVGATSGTRDVGVCPVALIEHR